VAGRDGSWTWGCARLKKDAVYVVVYGMPGCVPDDPEQNVCFSSLAKAQAHIAAERRAGRGAGRDPYRFDIIEISRDEARREGYEVL
jgi:hypothetical protein